MGFHGPVLRAFSLPGCVMSLRDRGGLVLRGQGGHGSDGELGAALKERAWSMAATGITKSLAAPAGSSKVSRAKADSDIPMAKHDAQYNP